MKNIYIQHANNTLNYGTFMMLINFIYYVHKNSKDDLTFFIEFSTEEDYLRLKEELKNEKIKIIPIKTYKTVEMVSILDKIKKLFFILFKYNKEILSYKPDVVVVLGGDDFSEYYGKIAIAIYMLMVRKLSKNVEMFFIGQTIGPFSSYRKKIAYNLFNNVNISLRDSFSKKYMLEDLNIDESKLPVFSDLAFLDLPLQNDNLSILTKYNLYKDEYIVIVPSGLYYKYTNNLDNYLLNLVKVIEYISNNKKTKGKKIVILGHVLKPNKSSDSIIINKLKNILKYNLLSKTVIISNEILASEARKILGNSLFTVTGRMHPAVSSFQTNKPVISLSYSIKYKGVIENDLGMGELVVDAKGDELWDKGFVLKDTINSINYILDNYDKIIKKISINVNKTKIKSFENIKYFISNINNNDK